MSRNPIPPRVPPTVLPAGQRPTQSPPPQTPRAPAAPASSFVPPKQLALAAPDGPEIVARAATYYRMTCYTMVVLLLGSAGWFAYGGWNGWPSENERHGRNLNDLEQAL